MVTLKINGKEICVSENTTILEAAKQAGIKIPTLCYLKELNEVGACRVCVVEVVGQEKLVAACNTVVVEGMEVLTHSERAMAARKANVELILSAHSCHCPTCVRSGNCSLQRVANELNILDLPFETKLPKKDWDPAFPLQRDAQKCIQCMRCINVCEKVQSLGVWELNGSGSHAHIDLRDGIDLSKINCALCGQCITHCPVGALSARDDTAKAFGAINDPEMVTVIQIAPAVRSAWAENLNVPEELATEKRMAAACKALGADYVFDTNFSADLTIMEEGSEFVERLTKNETMPMFTSCCPGWVRFMKYEYPELCGHLSSAKSPQQMFGALTKSYFAEKIGVDPSRIFCISIMPCVAKKYECDVPELNSSAGKDVDMVLTTRELARMLKMKNVDVASLPEAEFDSPLGTGSGAAVIFGATGGVMEAALRSAYYLVAGKNVENPDTFKQVRGGENNTGIREVTYTLPGNIKVRTAVASGLANARKLCELVKAGKAPYDFIEIMACPGGCAGGGGQPIHDGEELAVSRGEKLYTLDTGNKLRYSHENPEVAALYKDYLEKPLSHKSHELLHTDESKWTL